MQRPRKIIHDTPTQRPYTFLETSSNTTREWLSSYRGVAIMISCFIAGAILLTATKNWSAAISNNVIENSVMDSVAEPNTAQRSSGSARAEILDQTEKIQGFSDSYPTYELAEDVASVPLTETESETILEKVEEVVKEEIAEEEADHTINQIRYTDQKAYDAAPYINVPPLKFMKQPLWWALKPYESYYAKHPLKWYIPRLDPNVKLTPELFHEHFRRHAMPVIINAQSLRHLGYRTRAWSFDELRKVFPYNETKAFNIVKDYKANSIRRDEEEIDLGPGLASIIRDEKLAKQGTLRNYPRNLHIKRESLARLEVDYPPLISGGSSTWQLPTLWLGTSTADTPFHHDCCDNFVVMIAGIKRMTLAPPTDWRTLSPVCSGPNKSLCWAKVSDPNKADLPRKSQEIVDAMHKIVVDLQPGEILYMPAGWFRKSE
jgi:hypothetical protein